MVHDERFEFPKSYQKVLFLFMALGLVVLGVTLYLDPERAWANILLNNFYFVSISLGAVFIIAIQYVSNASWGVVYRRIPEAMSCYLPVAAVIMLLLYFGLHSLYHWTHHGAVAHDHLLQHKSPYLNVPFFMLRVVIIFSIWIPIATWLAKNSIRQDTEGGMALTQKNQAISAVFIVLFALSYTVASYDWIMSLEPHWFSTIFSIYTFAGLFFHSAAVMTMIVLMLLDAGYLRKYINENHLHDMGKLIFAFSTFWAYCWFCQYMLIWYANIPEETIYFVRRHEGAWMGLFLANFVLNWIFPFLVLMSRGSKRKKGILWLVCVVLMLAHWIEVYLLVFPGIIEKPVFGLPEIFGYVGFLSLFFWVVFKALSRASLIPLKDPYLEEGLKFHQ